MNWYQLNRVLLPLAAVAFVVYAFQRWGWPGVAGASGLLVMWVLMHFTRIMQILKRAANRPLGYVDSAVMLNAKLRSGMSLLHVLAMTRALGDQQSEKDQQPEVFRWKDNSDSWVDAIFVQGRLKSWTLTRPSGE